MTFLSFALIYNLTQHYPLALCRSTMSIPLNKQGHLKIDNLLLLRGGWSGTVSLGMALTIRVEEVASGSKRRAGVRWGGRWAANASVPCGSLFLPGSPEWLGWRD